MTVESRFEGFYPRFIESNYFDYTGLLKAEQYVTKHFYDKTAYFSVMYLNIVMWNKQC